VSDTEEPLNVFPPVTKADWIAKVEADLKGQPFAKLRSTIAGGLVREPLYTAEDVTDVQPAGLPGLYPFVRGASPVGGWKLQQVYDDPRPRVCKEQIRRDLERGAEGLWLRLGPRRGCRVLTIAELDDLLGAVDLARSPVGLDGGADALAVAAGFLAVARRRDVAHEALSGSLGFDPIALLAGEGRIEGGLAARFAELQDLASWCATHAPRLRAAHVDGAPYARGGASAMQEVSYTIATGIEYLRRLGDAGLAIDEAARQIGFSYDVSGDFFLQVAKLRAARGLWAKVVVQAGGEPAAAGMQMHCTTSRFTKTKRDPWVNMLRATAECAAAVLGGAQTIATLPFDCIIGPPSELAQRVARNTQIVLREESHLDAVADPAGGSWFVERLTEELARAAWEEVRSIEAAGGIVKALGSGRIVDGIGEVARTRHREVATRKAPIVGVSDFPNLHEPRVEREPASSEEVRRQVESSLNSLDPSAHRENLLSLARLVKDEQRNLGALCEACITAATGGADIYSMATVLQHGQPDFHLEPIASWRASEPWEKLRERADRASERPRAFLANWGPPASHNARSTWARNLLAAAGIESLGNDGFGDIAALARAWKESSTPIAIICGSDRDYEAMLDEAVAALKAAGCPLLLVAGRPGEREALLREAGVSDFVFVGADVLDVMTRTLDSIGVPR
jgi:methylmalonyl-CoA mutase